MLHGCVEMGVLDTSSARIYVVVSSLFQVVVGGGVVFFF